MDIIEILKVIFFGIVEGITEWLPISSTGHMILVDEFVKLDVSKGFWDVFLVLIQLGAVLAVVVLDFRKLWPFHRKNPELPGNWNYMSGNPRLEKIQIFCDNHVYMSKIILWLKILVSCVPAIIIGLPFNDWIEEHLNNYIVVAIMLIVYGLLFIVVERYNKTRRPAMTRLSEHLISDRASDRSFSASRGHSRNFAFGRDDCGRNPDRYVEKAGGGIYILPSDPHDGGSQPSEASQSGICVQQHGSCLPASGHGGRFCGVHPRDQVPDELYQEARLPGVRMVPHCTRYCGTRLFHNQDPGNCIAVFCGRHLLQRKGCLPLSVCLPAHSFLHFPSGELIINIRIQMLHRRSRRLFCTQRAVGSSRESAQKRVRKDDKRGIVLWIRNE